MFQLFQAFKLLIWWGRGIVGLGFGSPPPPPSIGGVSVAVNLKLLRTGYTFFAVFCAFQFMALRFKSVVLVILTSVLFINVKTCLSLFLFLTSLK